MAHDEEMRRLLDGPRPAERPHGIGLVQLVAHCEGDASEVLKRVREVLSVVLASEPANWPPADAWRSILPAWFVSACAPEVTHAEAIAAVERRRERWQGLSVEEQSREVEQMRWSLSAWIHWFSPGQREWFWWDAEVSEFDTLHIRVEIDGHPFPSGSLRWLLKAAGARSVEEEDAL